MFMGGGIFGLLIIGALIYFLFNQSDRFKANTDNKKNDDALETLRIRFVNGEISEEEYQQKKNILKGDRF